MSNLTVFDFVGNQVRVIIINGEPWWIASDVAIALGYSDPHDAIRRHVEAEDKLSGVLPDSRIIAINESGLYSLILSCKLESAKNFKRWVTSEVIPQIRKTGKYEALDFPKRTLGEEARDIRESAETFMYIHQVIADTDPRMAQIMIDRLAYHIQGGQAVLLPSENESRLAGCVEIAQEIIGIKVGKDEQMLGKYCAKAWRKAYDNEPQRVKRECGGAFREIMVYPANDPIILDAIREFYSR